MNENQRKICLRAIDHFGVSAQKWKLVEELGELLVEIAREQIGRGNKEAIREELADATIMCEQMRLVYGQKEVDSWIRRKLARLCLLLRPKPGTLQRERKDINLESLLTRFWRDPREARGDRR